MLAAPLTDEERSAAKNFMAELARRREADEERKRIEKQIGAAREARAQSETAKQALAGDSSRPQLRRSDEVTVPVPPPSPAEKIVQKREEIGTRENRTVSVSGTVEKTTCQPDNSMAVTVSSPGTDTLLHITDFYKTPFTSRTWTPPDPFLPCSQLAGLPARITYYPLKGGRYAGEVASVEITKSK